MLGRPDLDLGALGVHAARIAVAHGWKTGVSGQRRGTARLFDAPGYSTKTSLESQQNTLAMQGAQVFVDDNKLRVRMGSDKNDPELTFTRVLIAQHLQNTVQSIASIYDLT